MQAVKFSAAKAIFYPFSTHEEENAVRQNNAVNQYGFYTPLDLTSYAEEGNLTLHPVIVRLTARNVYRLYVNGEIAMHGPARTAHGYARVDEVDVTDYLTDGVNHIAVEVVAYGDLCEAYNRYSNDCTLEEGLFIAEVEAGGQVLTATGREDWQVCRITARAPRSERISHSRECTEIYTLDDSYYLWKLGYGDFSSALPRESEPIYLLHDALMPTLRAHRFDHLLSFGACRIDPEKKISPLFFEAGSAYYAGLPEHPTADCRRTVDVMDGQVAAERGEDGLTLAPTHTDSFYALWDGGESRVGFIRLAVTCETAGIIDIVHTELLNPDGTIPYYHNIVTRLHVPAGLTEFVTMEPALARYMTVYFRGTGTVTLHSLAMLDDAYPDEHRSSFLCSNDNINRLYGAAKKTLLLNTLDIFMDCPERERGGWLCDSLWTARAAALMLSDSRVEREFLENFLLTPADGMFHGFFPEVYPALKGDYKAMTGITTWSFWLMCEVCEYIRRTGDFMFRDEHKPRIAAFVNDTKDFLGKSGLLEHLPWLFVDWSTSNYEEYNQPVSTAANALYAFMLTELGETFGESDWVAEGQRVREVLRRAVTVSGSMDTLTQVPDSFTVDESGGLQSRGRYSESASAIALWSGLFAPGEAPALDRHVRDCQGPAPVYAPDPMVGRSQLFIGLCIRLDALCRRGCYDKMYEDMLAIFEPQLREGPGTLWEDQSIDTSSRCHGFTAHVGVHLMRDVLGLGIPTFEKDGEGKRTVVIAPHICGLRWARGSHETPEGIITVAWRYDGESFHLKVDAPAAYDCRVELPREIRMLDEDRICIVTNHD